MKKEKNVLITPKAYKMLIEEYQFQPSQLLAKLPQSKTKINSPKTNRFILVGSKTFMNLLNDYTEEELMLRRDGYIESPESHLPIRVFGKTFLKLLPQHDLKFLLSLPRMSRGDHTEGIDYNTHVSQLPIKKIKGDKKILKDEELNQLILHDNQLIVFSRAEHVQVNGKNDKKSTAFYCSAYFFNKGSLNSFTECIEYRSESEEFDYIYNQRGSPDVTTCEQVKLYMNDENSSELEKIVIYDVDLISFSKKMIQNGLNVKYCQEYACQKINTFYKKVNDKLLFNLIETHIWFESHARLIKSIPMNKKLSINEQLVHTLEDYDTYNNDYEQFEELVNLKALLIKEIDIYYKHCIDYFNTAFI